MIKNPPVNSGDAGLIPGLGRSLGEGNGNPLQYPTDRVAWWATVHGVVRSHAHWQFVCVVFVVCLFLF